MVDITNQGAEVMDTSETQSLSAPATAWQRFIWAIDTCKGLLMPRK